MATELPAPPLLRDKTPTVLACTECEVTWFDLPTAPCWLCDQTGEQLRPERLVLD